jgi:hypothetical protein
MFLAIDRTAKLAFVELHEEAMRAVARDFFNRLVEAVPYKIHTVLADNCMHFTTPGNVASAASLIKEGIELVEPLWGPAYEIACARLDTDHRLTKPRLQRTTAKSSA